MLRSSWSLRPSSPPPSRRGPLGWTVALLLSAACWWALFAGVPGGHDGIGLMFAGGWTLSLLPIHSTRWVRRPARSAAARPSAAQPEPPGSGVEAGPLQDGAEL